MNTTIASQVAHEVKELPQKRQQEVLAYVQFLKIRKVPGTVGAWHRRGQVDISGEQPVCLDSAAVG